MFFWPAAIAKWHEGSCPKLADQLAVFGWLLVPSRLDYQPLTQGKWVRPHCFPSGETKTWERGGNQAYWPRCASKVIVELEAPLSTHSVWVMVGVHHFRLRVVFPVSWKWHHKWQFEWICLLEVVLISGCAKLVLDRCIVGSFYPVKRNMNVNVVVSWWGGGGGGGGMGSMSLHAPTANDLEGYQFEVFLPRHGNFWVDVI